MPRPPNAAVIFKLLFCCFRKFSLSKFEPWARWLVCQPMQSWTSQPQLQVELMQNQPIADLCKRIFSHHHRIVCHSSRSTCDTFFHSMHWARIGKHRYMNHGICLLVFWFNLDTCVLSALVSKSKTFCISSVSASLPRAGAASCAAANANANGRIQQTNKCTQAFL